MATKKSDMTQGTLFPTLEEERTARQREYQRRADFKRRDKRRESDLANAAHRKQTRDARRSVQGAELNAKHRERMANDPAYRERVQQRNRTTYLRGKENPQVQAADRERKRAWNLANYAELKARRSTPEYREEKNARRRERFATDPVYRARVQQRAHAAHIRNYRENPEKREEMKAKQMAYHWKNREWRILRARVRRVGATEEDYFAKLEKQKGRCAICHREPPLEKRGNKMVSGFALDHDHRTGQVRGLLCHDCNKALGMLQDSPTILMNAWCYLTSYSADAATVLADTVEITHNE